jgi:hypothetical protein
MTNNKPFIFELEIFLRRLSEMSGDVKKLHSMEISEFAQDAAAQLEVMGDEMEDENESGDDGLP